MAARSGAYTSGKSFNSKFVVARSLQEKAAGIVIIIIIFVFFFAIFYHFCPQQIVTVHC